MHHVGERDEMTHEVSILEGEEDSVGATVGTGLAVCAKKNHTSAKDRESEREMADRRNQTQDAGPDCIKYKPARCIGLSVEATTSAV